MRKLKFLYLEWSKLTTPIDKQTFSGLVNLEELIFGYNQIESIEPGSFYHMSKLKNLRLVYNKLTRIDKQTFSGLVNLESLDLSSNQIKSIENGSFSQLSGLKHLEVQRNPLKFIDGSLLRGLVNLETLGFTFDDQITNLELSSLDHLTSLTKLVVHNLTRVDSSILGTFMFNLKRARPGITIEVQNY